MNPQKDLGLVTSVGLNLFTRLHSHWILQPLNLWDPTIHSFESEFTLCCCSKERRRPFSCSGNTHVIIINPSLHSHLLLSCCWPPCSPLVKATLRSPSPLTSSECWFVLDKLCSAALSDHLRDSLLSSSWFPALCSFVLTQLFLRLPLSFHVMFNSYFRGVPSRVKY